ncbi:hypothetical protein CDSM653_02376 [Caldanaerobacter subterraneus subsp. pacificus DSM 12653]|uniref:Uncharacterized protein n=1 Tax=Caldanaerobacter subterraneus subsp. pacificus DSM 12653 TaxID=391606 RepID=A0A0F5PL98_9THEO|nr:hypothetical protein CDSM653_02376 [Caldanaerobacter subterraneus subsp. pacificus DSM 12653]
MNYFKVEIFIISRRKLAIDVELYIVKSRTVR